eukprot:CAMPEP_0176355196 /NCGR_PEP_ID=MMETSP0126-20121128/13125_1 /TAXON_ID=141414 ORGANISM="Strombidinopsis acuminatum, Strain SPMC142" /NCGR_SAMPLE_ID=MMETSP0126 /ASSEMBLY_ACC=CAM_ASM_000229 /LENGTH=44 /DNA_ID= /DNA_START= /DNA_END= /DNA_ORIENTATION=
MRVSFPAQQDELIMIAFKTQREKQINVGREYSYEPMQLGECKIL